jgi:transposase
MSTSLVYHAFGATTYRYLKTDYREGAIFIHLEKKRKHQKCAACGSANVILEGVQRYQVRTVPIGNKSVFLVLHLHVLNCKDCGALLQENRDVAEPRKSYTRAFGRFVLGLLKYMTMSAVATHLKVGWDLIKSILKTDLEQKAKRRSWRNVRNIAIDEIAIRKGHRYMTVVVDLDSGDVLYAAEGKDQKCLQPFFRRLRRARAKLKAIAVDMSKAYSNAIKEYWKRKVAIVHDHYHLVSNMNDVVDKVRRDEQNRLEEEGKKIIKGSRYLLLRAKEKLEKMPEKQARLNELLAINDTLQRVYLLKEDLRLFWKQRSKRAAKKFVKQWIVEARAMGNPHVTRFANTVEEHIAPILAWYDHPITTGPLEGINNKIKVLKRAAYGYRDTSFFALRLLFIHETAFNLSGA